jgi:hypothetical protein
MKSLLLLWHYRPTQAWVASQLMLLGHTKLHTHPVGLRTSDQLVAEAATYAEHKTQQMNIHALSGIQTNDSSNQVAADLCHRPHGHRDRRYEITRSLKIIQLKYPQKM